jgi:hypothetical protein
VHMRAGLPLEDGHWADGSTSLASGCRHVNTREIPPAGRTLVC